VVKTISTWSDTKKLEVYNSLDGGKAILKTQDQLDRYLFSFIKMHQAKLNVAFSNFSTLNLNNSKKIQIIDYGCGQGIGSIALLDYLFSHKNFTSADIDDIILIEPSDIALEQAQSYLRDGFPDINCKLTNKTIDKITVNDLVTSQESIKIHVFSNILDVNAFNLDDLFNVICKSQKEENYFICISPDYYSGNIRLDKFIECFQNKIGYSVISERQDQISNPSNSYSPWKYYEKFFKVNF
jgi:hypothetical protein